MSKSIYILTIGILLTIPAIGQSSSTLMGARASGIGQAASCISDEWSTLNNIGGVAAVEQATAAFAHEINPGFGSFGRTAATCAVPFHYGVAGLSLFRFGDDLYSEQIISLGFGNTFGITSIGVKLNLIQYRADGFGTKGVISASIGGITRITKRLSIGTYITNINQPKISTADNEELPTIVTAGLGFKASETVFITSEIEKDLAYDPVWRTGMEYSINKKFKARTGFNINPAAFFLGFGFVTSKLKLDYAFQANATLGYSHHASVGYIFRKKEK